MERIRKAVLVVLLVVGLLAGFSLKSEAAPYFAIQLYDGTSSLVIQDNLNFQDLDPRPGVILWTGSVGKWSVEAQFAQTYDVLGGVSAPKIDLISANTSTAGGTLTIDVSAIGFLAPTESFKAAQVAIGGVTLGNGDSTVTAELFGGNSNVLLDKTNLIASTGPLVGDAYGVFGGSATGGFTPAVGNFSLTSEVVIGHNIAGTTTFNVYAAAVPEPFTLTFLGACLLGAGMAGRKFKT